MLEQPQPGVLAHRCRWEDGAIVAVHNLSSEPVSTTITLDADDVAGDRPVWLEDLFAEDAVEPDGRGRVEMALEAHGHRWLRVRRDARPGS